MKNEKQDAKVCDKHNKMTTKAIQDIAKCNDKVMNEQASLQNMVEKYLPLRILNMILEATEECFPPKQAKKLHEITAKMSDCLRAGVMDDIGNPTLKQVCLNLITKLRIEDNMLNEQKTGPVEVKKPEKKIPED